MKLKKKLKNYFDLIDLFILKLVLCSIYNHN